MMSLLKAAFVTACMATAAGARSKARCPSHTAPKPDPDTESCPVRVVNH
jgi:hypothetical protein